jgi:hypothetical protein
MNIKPRIAIPIMLVLLTAAGCTDAKPPKSDVVELATSAEPTLTSITPPAPSEPVEKSKKPEPPMQEPAEVPPVGEAQPFEPTLQSKDGITIQRLITAPAVEHREPVAASSVFGREGETVYAFVDISNESAEEKTLMVHFIGPQEQVGGGIELRIPPAVPRWRTWAYTKHAKQPGLWRVEIRGVDGTLLGALPFEVEPAR